jgi:hypothetical protein
MSMNPGSFRPEELTGADSGMTDAERAESYSAARGLEQAVGSEPFHPSAGFADRVMARVAKEPAPRPAGFLAPLLARHSLAGVVASVRTAWSIAVNGAGRPVGARGLALAYVLAVLLIGVSLTGAAAYGAAGAMGLLTPDGSPKPSLITPGPTRSPVASPEASEPARSDDPGESAEPSGSPEASESSEPGESSHPAISPAPGATVGPRASDDHGGATPSPSASDDHGGAGPGPSPSDDSGGGGSGGGASPTQSPRPSDTPKPSD